MNKKIIIFGGIGLVVVAIVVAIIILKTGEKKVNFVEVLKNIPITKKSHYEKLKQESESVKKLTNLFKWGD